MKKVVFLILLIIKLNNAWANPDENTAFNAGLAKYKAKDFAAAEAEWSPLIKMDSTNPPILYNQALALVQQQKWGPALAHARQGLLIEPRFNGFHQILNYIDFKMKTRGRQTEDSIASSFEDSFGKYFLLQEALLTHWVLSLVMILVLGALFRARRKSIRNGQEPPGWQSWHWLTASVWIIATLILLLKVTTSIDQKATVIASGPVAIRSAPMDSAAELSQIPEGSLVSIRDFYQDWVQVRFGQYPVGWITRKEVVLLTPEGFR